MPDDPDLPPPAESSPEESGGISKARSSEVQPAPANRRPPIPNGLGLLFAFGLVPVGMLIGLLGARSSWATATLIGGFCGLILGIPMSGGLALAARFYSGTAQRILAGLLCAVALLLAMVAVLFAGCMCLSGGRI